MYNETAYRLGSNRSCIRDLFEYGLMRAQVVGADKVYDYSLGNPSIPAPKEVNQTICEILRDTDSLAVHGYTPAVGDYNTRQAIVKDLNERYGTAITPEELFIGCGAAQELVSVLKALRIPGGEVLTIAPYFPEYGPWAEEAGLQLKVIPADIPDFQIRLEEVAARITQKTVAVIINSPNNPSGTVYTRKTLQKLAALLEEKSREYGHPVYIISDSPYRELAYGGVEVPFIPTLYPNTIECYSYSKSLSLPGERIGYIYIPKEAADAKALYAAIAGAARGVGHVCAPSLWQKVIARCTHLRPDLQAYDRNRTLLYESLLSYGYEVAKPDGAFYLFIKAPGGSAKEFSERAKQKDLLVVPGDDFGCPEYFRICYCVSYEKIVGSLPLFKELIEEYQ